MPHALDAPSMPGPEHHRPCAPGAGCRPVRGGAGACRDAREHRDPSGPGKLLASGKFRCTIVPLFLPDARIFPVIRPIIRNCWQIGVGWGAGAGEAAADTRMRHAGPVRPRGRETRGRPAREAHDLRAMRQFHEYPRPSGRPEHLGVTALQRIAAESPTAPRGTVAGFRAVPPPSVRKNQNHSAERTVVSHQPQPEPAPGLCSSCPDVPGLGCRLRAQAA